ncbi:hypothetical protein NC651_022172 [Populus alba x Populus x berolinensis]|nr:hypothetical protein NC651_022172 [Populus alba x Populus x berolinensis]
MYQEGLRFMNDHGVAYRDLNTHRMEVACLGDDGHSYCLQRAWVRQWSMKQTVIVCSLQRSLQVIQRISTETWMSNAYSFGMVVWEHGDRRGCLSCIHHLCRQQLTKRSPRELPANPNISDDQVLEQYPHQSALSSLKFYQFCFRPSNQYQ